MLFSGLKRVFSQIAYIVLALVISITVFVFAVWFPNLALILDVFASSDIQWIDKIWLPINLLGSIATNFSVFSATYTIVISLLLGIYIALLTFFIKKRVKDTKQSGVSTGFFGIASGVLGIGCAACGSFILTSILSVVGGSSLLLILPLQGQEFALIGIMLLTVSVYLLLKKIISPLVCPVN